MSGLGIARTELLNSPIFKPNSIRTLPELRILMEHHVYAVWDFMSLVKALQRAIAPANDIWIPPYDREGARMINEIVLCEESDYGPDGKTPMSHFELYLEAMREVGADTGQVEKFIENAATKGISNTMNETALPNSVAQFVSHTFDIIRSNKPWVICAAFAHGRESIIPDMFQRLRQANIIRNIDCPAFDYYLTRHIEVDGGDQNSPGHGELAIKLLNRLCKNNHDRQLEAEQAATSSLQMRTRFWLGVQSQIQALDAV